MLERERTKRNLLIEDSLKLKQCMMKNHADCSGNR